MLAVREEGWPVSGFTRHTQLFDQFVAPVLAEQRRIALLMVDALRYELAAELVTRLPHGIKARLDKALGQIPTITSVGMAALLPGADGKLALVEENGELVPAIGTKRVNGSTERVDYVRGIYGDRFAAVSLDNLLKAPRYRPKLKETVHLLLVKTTEIDTAGETSGRWASSGRSSPPTMASCSSASSPLGTRSRSPRGSGPCRRFAA